MGLALFAITQQPRGARRRIRSVIGTILTVLVALGLIGYGGYDTWLQHSGTVTRVHLKSCSSGHSRRGISWTQTCNGIWQHDGTKQTVRVYSVPRGVLVPTSTRAFTEMTPT
jgi:hypothetical protein